MAITNYSELQTAVADFLNRDDLTSVIPTFISLAEAQITRDLRHWRQQRRVTTTVDEQYENLPTDFVEMVSLRTDDDYTLEFASRGEIMRRKLDLGGTSGRPIVFTLNAGQIEFVPTPDASYTLEMVYYARIPALSDTDTFNWLLTNYPDVYLYGALLHAAPYLADDVRLAVWSQLYGTAIQQANNDSRKGLYSGPLVLRNK